MNKPIPFGKYYLLDRINVGGMAEVFKAKAFGVEGFERLVAVKRILPNIAEDEEFITMFIDEAKIAVQLQHANIAQIFDLGKVDDSFFIALEYVHGKDLRAIFDHLRKIDVTMPMPQACFMIMQVCEGLDYAHNKRDPQGRELNLVHRDVSPQNVLIGYEGEIKLVDFGIAKAAGKASKTQAGILKGKFGYMSPEQVRGLPVDRRSDIFSLGIVLYELLTGERLFVGESDFSTLEKVRNVEILPPSSFNKKIPSELERIVLKALAKDVEDRYQNAIDLHDDLQAFLYSVGEFYSRKDLSAWMKKTFAADLEEENAKLEEYEQLDEPRTPPPVQSHGGGYGMHQRGAAGVNGGGGLEWDEEELETQIFDRPPDMAAAPSDELSSADIFLQEGDDKTVASAPPEELLAAEANIAHRGPLSRGANAIGGSPSRRLGGPPPGISAFQQGHVPTPYEGVPSSNGMRPNGASMAGGPLPSFGDNPRAAYRQTLMGMPAPQLAPGVGQPLSSIPERRPLQHMAAPPSRPLNMKLVLGTLAAAVLVAAVFFGYKQMTRPGKLQLGVKPSDAVVTINGETVNSGNGPVTIERPPGLYSISISREGYLKLDRQVEIQAGQFERVELELDPSPDTGFELTSDPPGALVWIDGAPFMTPEDPPQQARTNFKAYKMTPGRHVIELKGDSRFNDHHFEFYQTPGKIEKFNVKLTPKGTPPVPTKTGAVATPSPSAAPPAPTPPPAPSPVPVTAEKAAPAAAPPAADPVEKKVVRPAPRPARRPVVAAPKNAGEDVFESEGKLGAGGAAPAAAEECSITLGSKPWSEVWIDGKNTGKVTPLVDHKIPCGKHKVTFKNPELEITKNETITVKSGEKFKKVVQLLETE